MKRKNIIVVMSIMILAVSLMCGLAACNSTPKEKTEDQVSADIQAQDNYFSDYNLKVRSFSISKRQTNADDKNDFVWCQITAANDDFSYTAEYKVTYILYNEGWILENCDKENSSVKPSHNPTVDEAAAIIHQEYGDNVEICAAISSESDTEITYPFYTLHDFDGPKRVSLYALFYYFSPDTGWTWEISWIRFV